MTETLSPIEQEDGITREAVIAAYKVFVDDGITNPDDLDLQDPEVMSANELFNHWQEQETERVKGNHEETLRFELARTMLYVDAGFTDPVYLGDIRSFLEEDSIKVEDESDNPEERTITRDLYETAKEKVEQLMAKEK